MRKTKDQTSRAFMFFRSSSIALAAGLPWACAAPCPGAAGRDAPYPAFSTADTICSGVGPPSQSTVIEPPSRFTFTSHTPSSFRTALSTWAEQAEQVMPVTLNFCFIYDSPH